MKLYMEMIRRLLQQRPLALILGGFCFLWGFGLIELTDAPIRSLLKYLAIFLAVELYIRECRVIFEDKGVITGFLMAAAASYFGALIMLALLFWAGTVLGEITEAIGAL